MSHGPRPPNRPSHHPPAYPAAASASASASEGTLVRGLGPFDASMVVVGIVIGAGIFLTSGIVARDLPSAPLMLLAWVLGGVLSLAGALTFAELGAAFPDSGGLYVYLREAYGSLAGFLFGWLTFLVYQTGALASLGVGFAEYLGYFVPALGTDRALTTLPLIGLEITAGKLVACVAVVALTAVNVQGLREGSVVQNVLTLAKVGVLGAFIVAGIWLGGRAVGASAAAGAAPAVPEGLGVLSAMGVALVAVLWTYDGWHNLTFTAGEVRDPGRNLPRALIAGTLAVTVIYLLTNVAYLRALPVSELAGEVRVAEKAAAALFGGAATSLIAFAVLVSTLGSANGVALTGARVYFAMARDGLFFERVGRVHPRHRTPHVSLWAQGGWACVLALSGRYDQIFTFATFAALLIYIAAAAAVFTLRRKRPDVSRPYRVPGYPLVPALFIVAVAVLVVNTLVERPVESLSGLLLLALGLPVYFYWRRAVPPKPSADPPATVAASSSETREP